jgi:hypothetical protein
VGAAQPPIPGLGLWVSQSVFTAAAAAALIAARVLAIRQPVVVVNTFVLLLPLSSSRLQEEPRVPLIRSGVQEEEEGEESNWFSLSKGYTEKEPQSQSLDPRLTPWQTHAVQLHPTPCATFVCEALLPNLVTHRRQTGCVFAGVERRFLWGRRTRRLRRR